MQQDDDKLVKILCKVDLLHRGHLKKGEWRQIGYWNEFEFGS